MLGALAVSLHYAPGNRILTPIDVLSIPVSAQTDPEWKAFSDERGTFSVMLPGKPVEEDNSTDKVSGRKFTLATTAVFMVGYQDLPADFPYDLEQHKELLTQLWDGERDAVISQSKAKLVSQTDILVDGHPGRLTKLQLTNGATYTGRELAVGKRLYQMFVITRSEAEAMRFLDSFKVTQPKSEKS
ncbi:MAG TPA: hypothetical protein VE961_21830 [Pyrinomonadaceae bacterium]|nr:hypothetical protein [Pyrinomonadaceae bacterium]